MPIGKRELAAYLALLSIGESPVSLGEAERVLELLFPRRAVKSVLKILAKSGFIEAGPGDTIRIREPRMALEEYLAGYIAARVERNLRSRHIEYSVERSPSGGYGISIGGEQGFCKGKSLSIGRVRIECRAIEPSTPRER